MAILQAHREVEAIRDASADKSLYTQSLPVESVDDNSFPLFYLFHFIVNTGNLLLFLAISFLRFINFWEESAASSMASATLNAKNNFCDSFLAKLHGIIAIKLIKHHEINNTIHEIDFELTDLKIYRSGRNPGHLKLKYKAYTEDQLKIYETELYKIRVILTNIKPITKHCELLLERSQTIFDLGCQTEKVTITSAEDLRSSLKKVINDLSKLLKNPSDQILRAYQIDKTVMTDNVTTQLHYLKEQLERAARSLAIHLKKLRDKSFIEESEDKLTRKKCAYRLWPTAERCAYPYAENGIEHYEVDGLIQTLNQETLPTFTIKLIDVPNREYRNAYYTKKIRLCEAALVVIRTDRERIYHEEQDSSLPYIDGTTHITKEKLLLELQGRFHKLRSKTGKPLSIKSKRHRAAMQWINSTQRTAADDIRALEDEMKRKHGSDILKLIYGKRSDAEVESMTHRVSRMSAEKRAQSSDISEHKQWLVSEELTGDDGHNFETQFDKGLIDAFTTFDNRKFASLYQIMVNKGGHAFGTPRFWSLMCIHSQQAIKVIPPVTGKQTLRMRMKLSKQRSLIALLKSLSQAFFALSENSTIAEIEELYPITQCQQSAAVANLCATLVRQDTANRTILSEIEASARKHEKSLRIAFNGGDKLAKHA